MATTPSAKADGRVAPRLVWLFLIAFQVQTVDATAQLYFHPFHHQLHDTAVDIPSKADSHSHHAGPSRIAAPKFPNLGALIKRFTPHARLANTFNRFEESVPQR